MSEFANEAAHFFNLAQALPGRWETSDSLTDRLLHRLDLVNHGPS
jgi:hypothetical protein